ncbi:C1 family peptidase [Microbacterium sulfonylureivorans]|uniref:C1 family peptidase n=1 Tax=Microbacterium sulfonylureivorans TaxID=2486854 RepID=UPI0013E0BF33|nr:C1 family peptidase [Microbacterium sulfonylureivorans]
MDAAIDDTDSAYAPSSLVIGPFRRAVTETYFDLDLAIDKVAGGTPVVMCLLTSPEFYDPDVSVITTWTGPIAGHAVVAIGLAIYDGPPIPGGPEPGARFLCLRNSWGADWGRAGHVLMSEVVARQCTQVALDIAPLDPDARSIRA